MRGTCFVFRKPLANNYFLENNVSKEILSNWGRVPFVNDFIFLILTMLCLFLIEMMKYIFILLVTLTITWMYVLFYNIKDDIAMKNFQPIADYVSSESIELTVRMTLKKKTIGRLFCVLLRSAVLFWNPKYGDVVLIMDEEDEGKNFVKKLNSLRLPFRFRLVYEERPKKTQEIIRLSKLQERSTGYIRMLYSSFLMDMYTDAPIIAWTDTDALFTMPVVKQSIMKNGKLIVKGMNTFSQQFWVPHWDHSTVNALGLPMVSDFMTFFPVYLYSSSIKNCREYIMKRLRTQNWEDAFIRITSRYVSPVNVIMSYAYYFERERYDWHIDTGTDILSKYNKQRLPKHPLLQNDVSPELHVSIHAPYHKSKVDPLERAICYSQMYFGMTNLTHCRAYHLPNMQLFEFQTTPVENHLETWCGNKTRYILCAKMIKERYNIFVHLYKTNRSSLQTNKLEVIEKFVKENYQTVCSTITYVRFP